MEVEKKKTRRKEQKKIWGAILLQSSNLVHKTRARVLPVLSSRDFYSGPVVLYLIKDMFLY